MPCYNGVAGCACDIAFVPCRGSIPFEELRRSNLPPPIIPKEHLLSVGRIVHAYCHRGTERYGPIAALVVQTDPPMIELHPGPVHDFLGLVATKWEVTHKPGLEKDQTIRQYISWEWPTRH